MSAKAKYDRAHPIAVAIFKAHGAAAVASQMGVSKAYVGKLRAQKYVPLEHVESFCKATGADPRSVAHPSTISIIDRLFATNGSIKQPSVIKSFLSTRRLSIMNSIRMS